MINLDWHIVCDRSFPVGSSFYPICFAGGGGIGIFVIFCRNIELWILGPVGLSSECLIYLSLSRITNPYQSLSLANENLKADG